MTKKERIIEAAVALVFGITILLTAIFTNAGVAIIVLGGLLTAVGVGCLIWALVDKSSTFELKMKAVEEPVKVVEETPHVAEAEVAKECVKAPSTKKTTSKKTAK